MADRDTEEKFLNFMLSEEVRSFCRFNVTTVSIEEKWDRDRSEGWEIWQREMIDLTDSTYHVCQAVT